jgi:tetratricopeptide (TPR) repeat protein
MFAWFVQPHQLFSAAPYKNLASAVLIAGIVIALVLLYTSMFKKWWGVDYNEAETPGIMKDFLWIGTLVIVCAVMPVILSGRDVDLYDAYKSYGLHPISGVILFVTGVVLMLKPNFRKLILITLIGISVSTQILNADYWGQLWDYQREMWWQLTWRAPDIKDDTLVTAYLPEGYRLQQDYEIWGPLNLIYNPEPAAAPAIQSEVLNSDTAFDIVKKSVLNNRVRDIKLHRDFNNLLLISMPSTISCFHVIDGLLPVYSESEALQVKQVGEYSRIDRIIPTGIAPIPPASMFGSEPAHEWCYYYQKVSLARQVGDWAEIGRLYDQALALNLEANDKAEVIPFFEGLVNLGRYDEAIVMYNKEIKGHPQMRYPVCVFLANNPGYSPALNYNYEMIYKILCNS